MAEQIHIHRLLETQSVDATHRGHVLQSIYRNLLGEVYSSHWLFKGGLKYRIILISSFASPSNGY